jgi:hypothetical protein
MPCILRNDALRSNTNVDNSLENMQRHALVSTQVICGLLNDHKEPGTPLLLAAAIPSWQIDLAVPYGSQQDTCLRVICLHHTIMRMKYLVTLLHITPTFHFALAFIYRVYMSIDIRKRKRFLDRENRKKRILCPVCPAAVYLAAVTNADQPVQPESACTHHPIPCIQHQTSSLYHC